VVPGSRAQRRNVRGVALLLVCLGLMALLPSGPVVAQTGGPVLTQSIVAQPIDNTQGNFADGVFQRTSLGPDKTSIQPEDPIAPVDQEGVVQLSPAGVLNDWTPLPNTLPQAVSGHGAAAIGNRIYAIGGAIAGGFTEAAYWATVDPITGAIRETSAGSGQFWTNNPMPAVLAIPYATPDNQPEVPAACATPTAKRTNVGVAGLATTATTGYIYAVGGTVNIPGCTQGISTPIVQRGTVAANGTITWTTLANANVPSPLTPDDKNIAGANDVSLGIEGASVVIARTRTAAGVNRYFLYVLGGKSVYISRADGGTRQRVLSTVYYSEVDIANGNLKHPTSGSASVVWQRLPNVPLLNTQITDEGLWNATASAPSVEVGSELKTMILLSGGAYDVDGTTPKISPYVYRATVSANGALTWSTTPGEGNSQVTLAARKGMSSLSYNNKFYAIGGRTTSAATSALDTVPTSFFNDSLNIIKVDGSFFFIGTDPVNDQVLASGNTGRYNTASTLVRAQPPATVPAGTTINSAWAYVLGGNNNAGNPTNTVFLGKLGGDEASNVVRAPDGWYYSGVIKTAFEVGSQNKLARVLSINWATDLGRNLNPKADIRLEFRKTITATGECPSDSVFTSSNEDRWRAVDGDTGSTFFSKTAVAGALFNKVSMSEVFASETLNATCMQYRAHLLQNGLDGTGPTTRSSSPKLLNIYLEKVIAGNADLNVPTGGFSLTTTADFRINSFVMRLQNLSDKGIGETLSVDDARLPHDEGSFFVNLCVAYNASASPSLTLPDPKTFTNADKVKCPAYAVIATSEMGKGTTLDLRQPPPAHLGLPSRWYSNAPGNAPLTSLLSLFSTPGYYRIGLVIDTYNYVPEGTTGEVNNRVETAAAPAGTTIAFRVVGDPVIVEPNNDLFLPLVRR
jgi:hypothetical protein